MITIGGTKYHHLPDVAKMLDVSHRTMYTYLGNKKFEAMKIGGKWLISDESLQEFIRQGGDKQIIPAWKKPQA